MMSKNTEIERIAKLIAFWHGQKMIYRNKDGMQTVASSHGYGNRGDSPDQYMHAHWQEYTSAAERILEEFQAKFDLGFKAAGGTITPVENL